MPSTSVIVTTYNRCRALDAVVQPLLDDPATHEVVVVVDHCTDGSIEWARRRAADDARVVPVWMERNVGQPEARAAGARVASGELLISLDDDVVAEPGLVSAHARSHGGAKRLVLVGYMPISLPAERTSDDVPTFQYSASYERHVDLWEADDSTILPSFWAGNFSVRRDDYLEAIDGAVLDLPYHEDRLLGLLLERAGFRARFDRAIRARHDYVRDWDGFYREGERVGAAKVRLHHFHPDLVGELDPDEIIDSYALLPRSVLRLADRPRGHRLVVPLIRRASTAAGRVRARDLQLHLALLGRHARERAGARAEGRALSQLTP